MRPITSNETSPGDTWQRRSRAIRSCSQARLQRWSASFSLGLWATDLSMRILQRAENSNASYVLSDYQHCGIGSRLMSAALTHPAMDGVQRLYLDVWEKNSDAIRLYERFGFRVVGSRRFEVASGEETNLDLIMMRITGAQP
jgi:GNAT superfamily N-acetyltransferase